MDAIVIGAGPAGLAVGACLQRAGVPFLILEQADGVGATWHGHYDRLHLHTPKSLSALPYLPFPKSYLRYPSRAQMIAYLEEYADHFGLQPRFGQHVLSARPAAGGWEVQTQETTFHAPNLVIATGNARVPYSPQWPGQADFRGTCLHSSAYRDGEPFRQRRVLVVGFGNSGGEIALDLCEHGAQTSMAVRSPVNVVPREVLGVPNVAITIAQTGLPPRVADALNAPILRLRFGDLTRYGLRRPPRGPLAQIDRHCVQFGQLFGDPTGCSAATTVTRRHRTLDGEHLRAVVAERQRENGEPEEDDRNAAKTDESRHDQDQPDVFRPDHRQRARREVRRQGLPEHLDHTRALGRVPVRRAERHLAHLAVVTELERGAARAPQALLFAAARGDLFGDAVDGGLGGARFEVSLGGRAGGARRGGLGRGGARVPGGRPGRVETVPQAGPGAGDRSDRFPNGDSVF